MLYIITHTEHIPQVLHSKANPPYLPPTWEAEDREDNDKGRGNNGFYSN